MANEAIERVERHLAEMEAAGFVNMTIELADVRAILATQAEMVKRIGEAVALIERGYRGVDKADLCEHGKCGFEDCIACYDDALLAALKDNKKLGQGPVA